MGLAVCDHVERPEVCRAGSLCGGGILINMCQLRLFRHRIGGTSQARSLECAEVLARRSYPPATFLQIYSDISHARPSRKPATFSTLTVTDNDSAAASRLLFPKTKPAAYLMPTFLFFWTSLRSTSKVFSRPERSCERDSALQAPLVLRALPPTVSGSFENVVPPTGSESAVAFHSRLPQ